jgi:hypothetical protein
LAIRGHLLRVSNSPAAQGKRLDNIFLLNGVRQFERTTDENQQANPSARTPVPPNSCHRRAVFQALVICEDDEADN